MIGFFGCIYAGAIAVPLCPPTTSKDFSKVTSPSSSPFLFNFISIHIILFHFYYFVLFLFIYLFIYQQLDNTILDCDPKLALTTSFLNRQIHIQLFNPFTKGGFGLKKLAFVSFFHSFIHSFFLLCFFRSLSFFLFIYFFSPSFFFEVSIDICR